MSTGRTPLLPLPPPHVCRDMRQAMGITLAEAAREIGVAEHTYMRWELGQHAPSLRHHRRYQAQLDDWRDALNAHG